ncbi:MAG: methyltransferase domain-containing protein [Candidatus Hydrogenedentes bacterium]|nr:methyltransferase domain-containing protein [Candidatus Hydrogenedentota bacterium]
MDNPAAEKAPNPWLAMTIDDAREYDERKETYPLRNHVALSRRVAWELILPHLPNDKSLEVLEVGGGTGFWSIRLALEGWRVMLTDPAQGLLDCAREKLLALGLLDKVTIMSADVCDLSAFASESRRLVLAMGDPLSYCGDAVKALREVWRVTQAGGVLIGNVECRYRGIDARRAPSWSDAQRILTEGIGYWPGPHHHLAIQMFTPSEFRSLAESVGWQMQVMRPSDLLLSLVGRELLNDAFARGIDLEELAELELRLGEDPSLLGAGTDIWFVMSKPR